MSKRILAVLLGLAMPLSAAHAQQPAPQITTAPLPTPPLTPPPSIAAPTPLDPVIAAIRTRFDTAGTAKQTGNSDVTVYYAQADAPIWTHSGGLTEKGRQALQEIAKAGDWGLDANAYKLPARPQVGASPEQLADVEIAIARAVVAYTTHARGGRLEPLAVSKLFDRKPRPTEATTILKAAAAAPATDAYLLSQHPRHEQFRLLRSALIKLRDADAETSTDVRIPAGPLIKAGDTHEHVALIRKRLGIKPNAPADANRLDADLLAAVKAYQKQAGLKPDGIIGSNTRAAFNVTVRTSTAEQRTIILANMERWRWMPENLGAFHVWDNIPEQISKVVDNGKIVFQERIIIGKRNTPTINFTAGMKYVEFQPSWYIPNSIKLNELRPKLVRSSRYNDYWALGSGSRSAADVLARQGLEASYRGRVVDPNSFDWSRVDITKVTFRQPPGRSNALGMVKFLFPNKHDIYMHDTPQRHLFKRSVRAYSHGCIRVENPLRFAEVLLAHDKGWSPSQVRKLTRDTETERVTLSTTIPVHVAYFTAVAKQDGSLHYVSDIYGMDSRTTLALAGKPLPDEPWAEPPAAPQVSQAPSPSRRSTRSRKPRAEREVVRYRQPSYSYSGSGGGNPFAHIFQN